MKKLLLISIVTLLFASKVSAQETSPLSDPKKYLGKTVTLCETIYSLNIMSDTLTLLNMGGSHPDQKFIVAIKGNRIVLDWANLKRKHICVTGVLELYKGIPEVIALLPNEIEFK